MTTGVLLMAHGTPASLDDMPEYLRLVRSGRPATPELVAEMRHNYAAIGGRSPLTELTETQAAALRGRLGDDVAATARGVAAHAGLARYELAYQSAGRTPEPWLGPDLRETIAARADAAARRFLIVPIGFVCDHTEILFDIDVQAAAAARERGATLRRTESLNTSAAFI